VGLIKEHKLGPRPAARTIINPLKKKKSKTQTYGNLLLYEKRKEKARGITPQQEESWMRERNYFGASGWWKPFGVADVRSSPA